MNNLFFQKCALDLCIIALCLSPWGPAFAKDQLKPTKPALVKKQPIKTKNEQHPQIYMETKEHDVGTIFEGMLAKYDFIVKNKGTGDLLINRVKPG